MAGWQAIRGRVATLNKAIVEYLCKSFHLPIHLAALRRVFFMAAGDVLHEFAIYLFKKLDQVCYQLRLIFLQLLLLRLLFLQLLLLRLLFLRDSSYFDSSYFIPSLFSSDVFLSQGEAWSEVETLNGMLQSCLPPMAGVEYGMVTAYTAAVHHQQRVRLRSDDKQDTSITGLSFCLSGRGERDCVSQSVVVLTTSERTAQNAPFLSPVWPLVSYHSPTTSEFFFLKKYVFCCATSNFFSFPGHSQNTPQHSKNIFEHRAWCTKQPCSVPWAESCFLFHSNGAFCLQ